ncbi:hypothetical protein EJV46_14560 [Roseococcus sp. SYP-B2431]|uniref:DUF6311 domain-containing protein n=1 Tax=Roseococcus sp. SYP-B2431 TaxID=2496640 RepID=UPI00103BF594|nr:DUF6311 domain-containing protein [Roseococcus sp. SYP-B2431]TCH97357.1 hypothetical protein EJV46_14560 [Roseococcus sp. SYP-B2431]
MRLPPFSSSFSGAALAALLGGAVILVVFGVQIVPPSHTGWMLSGQVGPDPVQYWLGWTYFRLAPWSLPPGLNPLFGMEISSSIFYADSIPLLAFAFKALRSVVEVDQYWGMWIVACGALQGMLAWLLIGRVTQDPLARLAGAMLFVLQPMLLNRMGGHFALSAQWLVLWGLLLALSPAGRLRWLAWAALVLAASLIHSYILPMVLALWAADWWSRRHVAEAVFVPAAGLAGLWAAGFFVLGAGHGNAQYGTMQLDLLAPFDPAFWGSLLPDLPDPEHPESGSSYLGLGALLLLPFLLFVPPRRRLVPLMVVLAAMLLFAVSHHVTIGGTTVATLPLPERLVTLLGMLRCSERYFWPLAYALILAGMAGLLRVAGPRWGGLALLALLLVQAVDLRPGYARVAHYFPPTADQLPLRLADPFWGEAAQRYRAIRLVPAGNQGRGWEEVAVFAARHGMATDAIYLARADAGAIERLRAEIAGRLARGDHEPGVLYVLRDAATAELARAGMQDGRDRMLRADGLDVLAPDWAVTSTVALTNWTSIASGEVPRPDVPVRVPPDPEKPDAHPQPPRL